jgi:hypothetical protein
VRFPRRLQPPAYFFPARAQRGTTKHDKLRQNTPKYDKRLARKAVELEILGRFSAFNI